jgi:hypothetical protein
MTPQQQGKQTELEFQSACREANWVLLCDDGFVEVISADERFCANRGGPRTYFIWVDG